MKRIKWISPTILLVILALVLAYITYPKSIEAKTGKTKITYWGPIYYGDRAKVAIDEFEKLYPEYKVEIGTGATKDGDPSRFLMGVAGGVPPDLICFDRFAIVEWSSRGAFTNLDPFIEKDAGTEDGLNPDDFLAAAWDECIFDGKMYAIPTDADNRTMYYNKDALVRGGFTYNKDDQEVQTGKVQVGEAKPPTTWKEMCDKLLEADADVKRDGTVILKDKSINLKELGVRSKDVVILLPDSNPSQVFRARIASVKNNNEFVIDFTRDLPSNITSIPTVNAGNSTVKIISQDSYVSKLTKFDSTTGRLRSAAFMPLWGNSWFYIYGWLAGGEFMNEDGTKCTLNDPKNIEAMEFITDIYDSYGGYEKAIVFQNSQGTIDPFMDDKIYMVININQYINNICNLKPNMRFGAVAPPMPEDQLEAGVHPFGWGGGWSVGIPATAKNKEGAWLLARYLTSFKAMKIINAYAASEQQSKGQLFIPTLNANKQVNEYLKEEYVDKSPMLSQDAKDAYDAFLSLLPYSKHRPVTPVGQKLWDEQVRAAETACSHVKTATEALDYGTEQVQIALDNYLSPPTGPIIAWGWFIFAYIFLIFLAMFLFIFVQIRKKNATSYQKRYWYEGYICASPWLIGFFTFGAGPIVFSIIISVSSYDVLNPARFVGLTNYINLLNDPLFWKSLGNTMYMIISVPLGILLGLALAILLNNRLKAMNLYRTLFYLPAIVPSVAAFILWIKILDPNIGFLNQFLMNIGIHSPPNWLGAPQWAKPALIIMGLWTVGGGMVIWLAGLKNIPSTLYDAAAVDGANSWKRFWHITLPMLSPYIFFNLIMGLIGVFQIFEQAYIMTNGGPQDATLFYAYKLFNEAFRFLNMGVASAMAWMLFFVVLIITGFNFWLGKKWVHYN